MTDGSDVSVEIRWPDVDAYGHVSHIALIGIAEHARSRWLDSLLEVTPDTWPYVVVHLNVDFRAPATFADRTVRARLQPTHVGRSSVRLDETLSAPDGRVLAQFETVIVAWDESGSASRRLTPQEADRLAQEAAQSGNAR